MKKILLGAALGLLWASPAGAGLAQEKQADKQASKTARVVLAQCALKVSGMVCGGCAGMVEAGLEKLDGVKEAKVDWKSGEVKLEFDSKKTSPEKIVAGFNQENPGFRAALPKPQKKE